MEDLYEKFWKYQLFLISSPSVLTQTTLLRFSASHVPTPTRSCEARVSLLFTSASGWLFPATSWCSGLTHRQPHKKFVCNGDKIIFVTHFKSRKNCVIIKSGEAKHLKIGKELFWQNDPMAKALFAAVQTGAGNAPSWTDSGAMEKENIAHSMAKLKRKFVNSSGFFCVDM